MSLSGARGLIRVAHNSDCELQAAMALERVREPAFYRELAGADFPGEYGERVSARRRGTQFEQNLFKDNAALLREILAPRLDLAPEQIVTRNLTAEVRGTSVAAFAERLRRTRAILRDLANERAVPQLLIQPQLQIRIDGDGDGDGVATEYIAPDLLVLDADAGCYVPAELKSFIVRNNIAAPSDLDSARRQAAVQVLALRDELAPLDLAQRVADRGVFIFATPFGLRPHPPFEEQLEAEVFEMARALRVMATVRRRLSALRGGRTTPLADLAPELAISYQESCVAGCALASLCKQRVSPRAVVLGDAVAEVLGPAMDLGRALALVGGATPASPQETELAAQLRDAVTALGWSPAMFTRAA
jgi:hypothetical protein